MSLFAWANSKLEQLSEQIAPVPNDPGIRFARACSSYDSNLAMQLLTSPPPFPDGSHCPAVDPFSSITNKQKGALAIHTAAEYGLTNVVQSLIGQYGVSAEQFDHQGNTPLHYAAMSKVPGALQLVKMLVNEYNVSVTVKNMNGKTAYDGATQDSVRQYLLPIQLQKETQECIDNGGRGLPEGIDMGGIRIKRDIAPPPIMGAGGYGPPVGGNTNYSAGGMTSKYAVPEFGQQQPPMAMNQPPAMPNYGAPSQGSNMYAQPHVPIPGQTLVDPPVQPNPVSMSNTTQPDIPAPPVSDVAIESSPLEPRNEEVTKEVKNETAKVSGENNSLTASSEEVKQPTNANNSNFNMNTATAPSLYTAPTAINNSTPSFPTTNNLNTVNAPNTAPNSTNGYARKGHSSAAVLPKNAKYKPDGFHSSSSDVNLQQKYGHDKSITGPPSGRYNTSNIAPPPSASNSGGGYNPYAVSAAYGSSPAMSRPRYPTYDAVSDTVGAATGSDYGGQNAYATPSQNVPQYNVYTPQPQSNQMPTSSSWKAATAPDGRTYYFNEVTNETTWTLPEMTQEAPAPSQADTVPIQQQQSVRAESSPPHPWKAATAPDGRTYYFNQDTQETTWEMPQQTQPNASIDAKNATEVVPEKEEKQLEEVKEESCSIEDTAQTQQQSATAEASPPHPWKAATAPDGRTYYFNQDTQETTWKMPQQTQANASIDEKEATEAVLEKEEKQLEEVKEETSIDGSKQDKETEDVLVEKEEKTEDPSPVEAVEVKAEESTVEPKEEDVASPSPWKAATAPDGRTYYFNQDTLETTWEMPHQGPAVSPEEKGPSQQQEQIADAAHSCPWKAAAAPDGRTYYFNEYTQETTWEMPPELQQKQNTTVSPSSNDQISDEQRSNPNVDNVSASSDERKDIKDTQDFFSSTTAQRSEDSSLQNNDNFGTSSLQRALITETSDNMAKPSVGEVARQSSIASASDLFSSPQSNHSTSSVFSQTKQALSEPIANEESDDTGDLPPPPIVSDLDNEHSGDDSDDLPPPPFGFDSSDVMDQSGDDDLPPPPMMEDISLE